MFTEETVLFYVVCASLYFAAGLLTLFWTAGPARVTSWHAASSWSRFVMLCKASLLVAYWPLFVGRIWWSGDRKS